MCVVSSVLWAVLALGSSTVQGVIIALRMLYSAPCGIGEAIAGTLATNGAVANV